MGREGQEAMTRRQGAAQSRLERLRPPREGLAADSSRAVRAPAQERRPGRGFVCGFCAHTATPPPTPQVQKKRERQRSGLYVGVGSPVGPGKGPRMWNSQAL